MNVGGAVPDPGRYTGRPCRTAAGAGLPDSQNYLAAADPHRSQRCCRSTMPAASGSRSRRCRQRRCKASSASTSRLVRTRRVSLPPAAAASSGRTRGTATPTPVDVQSARRGRDPDERCDRGGAVGRRHAPAGTRLPARRAGRRDVDRPDASGYDSGEMTSNLGHRPARHGGAAGKVRVRVDAGRRRSSGSNAVGWYGPSTAGGQASIPPARCCCRRRRRGRT